MPKRVEITSKILDTRAESKKKELISLGLSGKLVDIKLVDVYTIDFDFSDEQIPNGLRLEEQK